MFLKSRIKVFDLIMCLSDTIGLADPVLVNHNKEVAYIAFRIGEELGLKNGELAELILAGILHDIGYFSSEEKDELFNFVVYDAHKHGEIGYKLLKTYSPLLNVANIVRYHHVFWDKGKGKKFKDQDVPLASHIIHLADRISVVIDKNKEILGQVDNIYDLVVGQSDHMFKPELVKVFANIKDKEYLWLDLSSKNLTYILNNTVNDGMVDLGINALMELSQLFAKIIDFRSSFTATHSSGVAVIAEFLAEKIGFSKNQCKMMKIAGYLHDLGKLAIPSSILEKGDGLSDSEFKVMKSHVYYTYRTLESIKELNTINLWASLHHERLNGKGYPFHLKGEEIPLGSRIMAVADVFVAITEDRPYRDGLDKLSVLKILDNMVEANHLDSMVVSVLKENIEEMNLLRKTAQDIARREYVSMSSYE